MVTSTTHLTLQEFFSLPEGDRSYELVDGFAVPKMSPKFFHSRLQKTLLFLLNGWAENRGRVEPEWAVVLEKNGVDWVPVPDLTYISFSRLSADWLLDEPCPVAPELAIEIISPGEVASFEVSSKACDDRKTFGDLAEKAADYLKAGVSRVWIIDTKAKSITIFYLDALPQTIKGTTALSDDLFSELQFTPQQIFRQAGLSD